ncbi:unnamed protein product [Ectocarpus sp. 4 AP-2014]
MLCCTKRIKPGCGGRMLRDAFREGSHTNNARPRAAPLRSASTMQQCAAASGNESTVAVWSCVDPWTGRLRQRSSSRSSSSSSGSGGGGGGGGGGKVGGTLGLKEFMHRSRVLELYRGILKRARALEDKDVADEARRQFKSCLGETDHLKVQMMVADATNHLEAMQGSTRGAGSGGGGDGDSWLDIHDPEDKRGRVGESFPWQR